MNEGGELFKNDGENILGVEVGEGSADDSEEGGVGVDVMKGRAMIDVWVMV